MSALLLLLDPAPLGRRYALILVAALLAAPLSAANRVPPTTAKPSPLLDARTAEMRKIVDDAEAGLTTLHNLLDPLEPRRLENKLAAGDAKTVGPAAVLLTELRWRALRLTRRHEAAGHDLELRRARLETRLTAVVDQLRGLPNFNQTPLESQTRIAIGVALKQAPKLDQMVASGRLAEAESAYYKLLSEIDRTAIWLRNADLEREMRPLFDLQSRFQGALIDSDRAALQAELQAEISRLSPAYPAFVGEVQAAAAALASAGQAPWRGAALAAPELVRAQLGVWSQMQVAAHRVRAAAWSLQATGNGDVAARLQTFEAEQQAAAQQLPDLLAAVVRSEAQRATRAEAQAVYPQLLEELAPAAALGPREPWRRALDPALAALAAQASLTADVESYRRATAPVLHWRRRIARVEAARRAAQLTDLRTLCDPAIRQNPTDGFLPPQTLGLDSLYVLSPADDVLKRAAPDLVGKPVHVPDLVAAQTAIYSRLAQRVYASLAKPTAPALAEQAAALERSLYASGAGGLTLDAAAALWGARQGVYVSAGGVVQAAAAESLLARFGNLAEGDAPLLPHRELIATDFNQSPLAQAVLLHLRFKPQWLQHECFVAETP